MSTESSFEGIRKAAERETYSDGITEMVVGVLFFIVALASGRPAFYWTYLLAIVVLGPGRERLKSRFTYPRIGYVQLPDEAPKQLRRGILSWLLGVFFVVAVVLTATGHLTDNLAWRRASPVLAGLLFAGGFLYLAQRSQLRRHYALVFFSVLIGFVAAWPSELEPYGNLRVWAILMALLCLAMGAFVLRRFVLQNPIIEERAPNGQ